MRIKALTAARNKRGLSEGAATGRVADVEGVVDEPDGDESKRDETDTDERDECQGNEPEADETATDERATDE